MGFGIGLKCCCGTPGDCECTLTVSIVPSPDDRYPYINCYIEAVVTLVDCRGNPQDLTKNCIYVKIKDNYFGTSDEGPAADVLPWKKKHDIYTDYTIEAWQELPCPTATCDSIPNDTNNRATSTFRDPRPPCYACPQEECRRFLATTSTVAMSGFRDSWILRAPSINTDATTWECNPFSPVISYLETSYSGFGNLNFTHSTTETEYDLRCGNNDLYCPVTFPDPDILYLGEIKLEAQWFNLYPDPFNPTRCPSSPRSSITYELYSIFGRFSVDANGYPQSTPITLNPPFVCAPNELNDVHRVLIRVKAKNFIQEPDYGAGCYPYPPNNVTEPRNVGELVLGPGEVGDWYIYSGHTENIFSETPEGHFGPCGTERTIEFRPHFWPKPIYIPCLETFCESRENDSFSPRSCDDCHESFESDQWIVPNFRDCNIIPPPCCDDYPLWKWTRS